MTISNSSHNAIRIEWDDHSNDTKIFGRTNEFYIYEYKTSNNFFIDLGNISPIITSLSLTLL